MKKCKQEKNVQILNLDFEQALKEIKNRNIKFDLIFIDPPYLKGLGEKAIIQISNQKLLNTDGLIVLETDYNEFVPEVLGEFKLIDERKYGRVKIYIFN